MLKRLRTIVYYVSDLEVAKMWYSEMFNMKPYFDESIYAGFNIGEGIRLGSIRDPFGNVIGLIGITSAQSHAD